MEEYAASVEDEVAFRMELNAEARSSGRKPGELPDDVIPDDDDLGVGQRDKMEVDIEPGDPTGDMHEAESGYVHEDPDRPQHRVSADLLHDIVHREKELKAHAQKIDEPGRTAELSKTLDQFYSMHFPVYESLKQKTGQQAQSALSTALPGQAFASKAGTESAMLCRMLPVTAK